MMISTFMIYRNIMLEIKITSKIYETMRDFLLNNMKDKFSVHLFLKYFF